MEHIVSELNSRYQQVGIKIATYQTYRIDMQANGIDLGDGSATRIVDNVLASTIANGAARPDAMHILFVRRIGGTDNPKFDPAGYSMGLPGPYSHKRDTSGVLVATEKYAGSGGLDADGLSSSLAHEMGHYLGLYHTSEPDGATHDPLSDTPECLSGACDEPFLRNIMTSGRWLAGKAPSSRVLFSAGQGKVMRGHPLCVPMEVQANEPPVDQCSLACQPPTTCALKNQEMSCEEACNPASNTRCANGNTCDSDELGTYICM